MTDSRRVVVVGAGLGGLRVCENLRQLGFDGSLVLAGAEDGLPYDRPPLSKEVLKGARSNPPILRELGELEALSIELRLGRAAHGLDTAAKRVHFADGGELGYDVLVIATGARPRPWPLAGDTPNVWPLRSCDDAARIADAVARHCRIAVLGAGFIGSEVAASAREAGCDVTLVELLPTPMQHVLGTDAGAEIARMHRSAGVDLRCGVTIDDLVRDAGWASAIRLSDGSEVAVDAIVVGLGVVPNTEWLDTSGLVVEDGIVCDATGRTSAEDVYAVGDAARWTNTWSGRSRRVEHWTTTTEHAAIVASQIAHGAHERRQLDEVPYFWSDQYGVKIQCIGEVDAAADVELLTTGPSGDRPLHLYSRDGALTGVLGFGLARAVMRLRPLVAARAPVEAATAAVHELHASRPVGAG
jgi:3-phenylpropionate/trans-cinnamate dioxygenase ferredoxin reductase subunit